MRFRWRRGLAFAAIHLAICIPLVLWEEASNWDWVTQQENRSLPPPAPSSEGEVVSFSPCGMWERLSVPRQILNSAEGPAVALSGWRMCATYSWTPAGRAGASPFRHSRGIETQASIGLCAILFVIWLAVGSFPLRGFRAWYAGPGAFITACLVASAALLMVGGLPWLAMQRWTHAPHPWHAPEALMLAAFPAILAALGWLLWFGWLLWILLRFGALRIASAFRR